MDRTLRARAAVMDVAASVLGSTGPLRPAGSDPGGSTGATHLVTGVLETVVATVGGDATGFWEHVEHGWSSPLFVTPPEVWRRLPHSRTLTSVAAQIHPGIRHCLEARPAAPFTVTDLVSERAWQNSDLGRAMRPDWGRNFQLMVPIDTHTNDPTWWVWVVGRERTDFTPADRHVASAIQPVLTAVTRHVATLQRAELPVDLAAVLTAREQGVLALLLESHAAAEIAARLAVSTRTVHKHIEHIYRKLDVHGRPGLIAAVRAREVTADEESARSR